MRLSLATLIGAGLALVSLFLIHHTFEPIYQRSYQAAGRGPVFFPRILLGIMLVLSLAVMVQGLRETALRIEPALALRMAAVVAVTAAYVLAITRAGFLISSIAFALILPPLLGYRRPLPILAVAAIYPLAVWYLFDRVVRILLPASPWFDRF